jgi:hypothetical protein
MSLFYHFSTKADYEQLVQANELLSKLYFVCDDFFYSKEIPHYQGLLSLPDLGRINHARYDAGPRYFVFPEKPSLTLRPLATINSQKRFALDGESFTVCLLFTPNGLWGRDTLLCGAMEITNPIGVTRDLYRDVGKCFSRKYSKSKYYKKTTYAGPDALSLQSQGYRLCINPNLTSADDFELKSS